MLKLSWIEPLRFKGSNIVSYRRGVVLDPWVFASETELPYRCCDSFRKFLIYRWRYINTRLPTCTHKFIQGHLKRNPWEALCMQDSMPTHPQQITCYKGIYNIRLCLLFATIDVIQRDTIMFLFIKHEIHSRLLTHLWVAWSRGRWV